MTARIEQTGLVQREAGSSSSRAQAQAYAERFRAPFSLRCGALLIDYILLVIIVAFSTVWARLLGGGARMAGGTTETIGLLVAVAVTVLNFFVLAGVRGQTLGKWATGLRIERRDGGQVGIGRILLRHTVGYTLSLLIFGLGFLFAAFDSRGRALHDMLAGTLVVRSEARGIRGGVR
jgi:Mce-associated membrane protein